MLIKLKTNIFNVEDPRKKVFRTSDTPVLEVKDEERARSIIEKGLADEYPVPVFDYPPNREPEPVIEPDVVEEQPVADSEPDKVEETTTTEGPTVEDNANAEKLEEEPAADIPSYDDITIDEIKALLGEKGIDYTGLTKKADLYAKLK